MPTTMKQHRIIEILRDAKKLAQEYRTLTGEPLGITGEVAEYEAARLLGVQLTPARQAGYDAVEQSAGKPRHLQIKGRCLLPGCKPGQRLGSIDVTKDWDAVLMVFWMITLRPWKYTRLRAQPSSRLSLSRVQKHAMSAARLQ